MTGGDGIDDECRPGDRIAAGEDARQVRRQGFLVRLQKAPTGGLYLTLQAARALDADRWQRSPHPQG